MKSFLLLLLLGLLTPALGSAQSGMILWGGLQRTYTLRLPSSYAPGTPMPLVVAMHGGFGSGTQLENQSQLTAKAEEEGFIVVYPDGAQTGVLNIRTWNAGGCCGGSVTNNIDDVGFIDALLDRLILENSVDTTKIYATGMSNGGFMSYRLACELSHRIAAIAPVAASMTIAQCQPGRAVPVIAIHSYQDGSVPYLGGIGSGVSDHYNSPLDSVLNAWAAHADCSVLNDTIVFDNELTHIMWSDCACNATMELYLTRDGGHSWAGGSLSSPVADPPSTFVSANDLLWQFFEQYSLECTISTGMQEDIKPLRIQAFPNPSNGPLYLEGASMRSISVNDAAGRLLLVQATQNTERETLDLQHFPSGFYTVNAVLTSGERTSTRVLLVR